MNNTGSTFAKLAMLAGGAVLGALLARWMDDWFAAQGDEQSRRADYDRDRYAQGLTAQPLPPQGPPQTSFQVTPEEHQQYE